MDRFLLHLFILNGYHLHKAKSQFLLLKILRKVN
jgi:hypothetical protein